MKIKIAFKILAVIAATSFFAACHDEHDAQELITTVRVKLTADGTTRTFTWQDKDGTGGTAPIIDTLKLAPNKNYTFTLEVADESGSVATDLTSEISTESAAHLFVYKVSGANLMVKNLNLDSNGKTLGLSGNMETQAASSGNVNIILKHEPNKSATSPETTGETDVDITFPVVIK